MHDPAIELLIIGNPQSETEGYLTALRNSGIAVHAHPIEHDIDAISAACRTPIDLILYTTETGNISIPEVLDSASQQGLTTSLIALAEAYSNDVRTELMTQGASDLVERTKNQLLTQVIKREYANLCAQRDFLTTKHKLEESEERCNLLTEGSRDAIAYIHEGMHIKANSAYLQLLGLRDEDDIEGLPILDLIAPSEHKEFKQLLRKLSLQNDQNTALASSCVRSDGTEFSAQLNFSPAFMEGEPCTQVIILDQSISKEVEERLRLLSTQDTHTGLYNRQHFLNVLDEVCQSLSESNQCALFYITLDNFKEIRDKAGMLASDSVITEVAVLLKEVSATEDILARFGDHTFTLLTRLDKKTSVHNLGKRICDLIESHDYQEISLDLTPTCSLGITFSSAEFPNANDFINHAYQACEKAKLQGGNQPYLEDEHPEQDKHESGSEADLNTLIRHALETNQFRLVYQPIVSLHGDTRENYAVLVRLLDNNQEEIHPDHFLIQLESMGKMAELDRWVIRSAISELARHRSQGDKVNFFINISGASLEDEMLLLWICDCLREFEAKGTWLVFQIHDSDARDKMHNIQKLLDGLKKIKCRISIDHFGLAPKPQAALERLPIDFVQFDQQLIDGLSEDQEKQDKLNELNRLAQKLNVKTVAAGVEESSSLAILWSVGVNYIRGYFIQEPSPTINYDFNSESSGQ